MADQYHKGLIPRNYHAHPTGCFAAATPFPDALLIPESEWKDRWEDKRAHGSVMKQIAHDTPIIDQDGYGYCWAHSSTQAVSILRQVQGEPYVPLSAFAVAAVIKRGRDEGGCGVDSLTWIAQNGVPTQDLWPQGSASLSHDTPAMRADAAKRKVTEWWDGYDDQDHNWHILVSMWLVDMAGALDYNEWSHSIYGPVDITDLANRKITIKNSWKGWGDNGVAPPEVRDHRPDGIVIPRVVMASN